MMPTPIRSTQVRVPKAGELVAAQLRRQIVTGELREGDALPPESTLVEQYGVSRPTLREAFRILEAEHIIEIKRGARGGAHVLVPDAGAAGRYAGALLQYRGTMLADLYEARTHLEAASVDMLARRRSAADLRKLDIAVAESEAALPDPVAYAEKHEIQFHRLLIELAGNQTMTVLLEMLLSIIELHNQSFLRSHPVDETSEDSARAAQRAHAKLVELIRAKAADKAVALWNQHLRSVSEYMISDPNETVLDVLS
jgi:DNA-binding FadR family transcriptional regulator